MDKKEWGAHVRQLRLAQGMTLCAFAASVGVSTVAMSKAERGYSTPRMENIKKMEKVLKLKHATLLRLTPQYSELLDSIEGRRKVQSE